MSESAFPRRNDSRRVDAKASGQSSALAHDGRPPSAQRHGYLACYQMFLAAARALPAAQVATFRGNPRVALANVRFGLDNACADEAAVREHLPRIALDEAFSVADVARGLIYACGLVATPVSRQDTRARVTKLKEPRAQMLGVADTLAAKNLLPADDVATVHKAQGMSGFATGAVMLHGLYTKHADAIRGMHPFSESDVREFGDDAAWLMENLKPKNARTRAKPGARSAADDRDRFAALLVARYKIVRRIGHYFHPDDVDAVVPPMLSSDRAVTLPDEIVDPATPPVPSSPA